MRRYLPIWIVVGVAVITLIAGGALYRAYKPSVLSISQDQAIASKTEAVHARGPAKAPVTLEEFGDFQCPPCGALSEPLNQLLREYETKVRFIFREYPLSNHRNAIPAALAAEAAGLQGRFWEMHDLLYREQTNWSNADAPRELFLGYAKSLGLDLTRFEKEMDGPEVKERLARDQQRAQEFGVRVTPTIFVNGKSVSGPSLNPAGLRTAIDAALMEPSAPKNG